MERGARITGPRGPAARTPRHGGRGPRPSRRGLLAALVLFALWLLPTSALALTTENFQTDLGPLDANPAGYRGLDYTLRDGSRSVVGLSRWSVDGGFDASVNPMGDGCLITDWPSDLGTVREIDIARTGGGKFNFNGVALCNYTDNGGGIHAAVSVTIQGYSGGTKIYDSGPQTMPQVGYGWLSYTPGSLWIGLDEVRIVASERLDPYVDNVSYDFASATTSAASAITSTGATLNGVVNPQGGSAAVTFGYGLTTAYGSTATAAESPVTGSSNTPVSAAVTGLTCGTTYHYRVTATMGGLPYNGDDVTFATSACNIAPAFVGATTTLSVVRDAAATDVKDLLHVSDTSSGQTLTWSQSVAPDHGGTLSFSGATASSGGTDIAPGGSITYTPAGGYTGTETFTVQVGDGEATATRTITVTVKTPQTITFANPGVQDFGTSPTLSATASSTLAVSFSSGTPAVCTTTGAGALTFVATGACTINADQAGDATYAPAPQVSQSFTVAPVAPGAPTIGAATAGDHQATVSFTAPASTGGAAITSYTVTASPGGNTGTGAASPITVSGLTNGTSYTFTVTATNSAGTGPASAASAGVTPKSGQTISFANPGTQTYGTSPTLSATASSGLTVGFSSATPAVCTITGAGALTFVNTGACTINADQAGDATYLPAPQVNQSFTVAGPTVTISPTSLPAAISGAAYSQTLTAGGSTAPYTFAVTSGALPAGMSLSAAGVLSGACVVEGSSTFTVTATDASASHFTGSQGYTLAVNPLAPVANAVSTSVAYNSAGNAVPLSITGGAPASVAVAAAPGHGAAAVVGLGITYTPVSGYSGADSFTYTATNAGGTSAPAVVSVTVTALAPVAGAVSVNVLADSSGNAIPLNVTGGAPASVAVTSAPGHGTATVGGTSITYTPTTGYIGADSFAYTATNSGGTSAPATVTITVQARPNPAQDATVQGLVSAQVTAANRFAKAQISNFQSRLEDLHDRPEPTRNGAPPPQARTGGRSSGSTGWSPGNGQTGPATPFPPRTWDAKAWGPGAAARNSETPPLSALASGLGISGFGGLSGGWDIGSLLMAAAKSSERSGSRVAPLPSLNLDSETDDLLGTGLSAWTGGAISIGSSTDSDTSFTTSGVSAGMDFRVNDQLLLGMGVGYGHEYATIGDDGSKSTGDSYGVMFYGSFLPLEGFFLDGLVGVNHLDFDIRRYVGAAGTHATSERQGTQWLTSISGGYEFKTSSLMLSPYGRLDLASTHLDRSEESGAGAYDLVYFKQDLSTTRLALGLRGSLLYTYESLTAKPFARVEYQRDFSDSGVATMAYADQGTSGATYQYSLSPTDRNTLVLGGGADLLFRDSWQLGLEYRYTQGSSTRMQTMRALLQKVLTF
ncbi:autotransporter domain-containing protein [Desulfovibrio aminophilus]|nr:autotransporter domain-containing protein [Desulfovibrio aminophilus]MCM0755717.1 autotransporter domain-containing protein [Desulfovibrio aminophilus]